jgi:uncharacterized protein (DUF342 family)
VRARFLENASVVAHGSLEILAGVMKSHLQTLDKVIMGPRGLILGGKVEAQNGIDVFQVGNSQGIRTELVCGLDFTVLEKMEWARTQSTSLVRQLKTLETHRLAHPAQGKLLDAACSRVRNQVLKLNEMSRRLVSGVDANDQASVTVRGMVYGGTSIEICHVTLNVVRPLSRVRFSLDKSRGVIREEHL